MNTKICTACGQTNFPGADFCSNCQFTFSQTANNTGGKTPAAKQEKSNKMLWILGGVGALVFVGGFLIVALVGGIYYFAGSANEVVETTKVESDSDTNTKKIADTRTDDNKKDDKTNVSGDWKNTIETKHSNLGKFKLQSVSKIEEKKKMIFRESSDEAFALYSTSDKNPLEILFSVANFSTISDAKADVAAIKSKIKSTKNGKIIKESKLSDGVIISYRKNKLIGILDCKDKVCTQTTGIDGKKVSDFYKQVTDNIF